MFSYIKGILEYKGKDYAVVDVNGVGYKIHTAASSLQDVEMKSEVKMYTYMHVREDIMALYGFTTSQELETFELLISVSGIGPKAGLAVLSNISPSKFALCLVTNDSKTLTKIPGIGAKTAQRIILELKDKVKSEQLVDEPTDVFVGSNDKHSEAINALTVLGYSQYEASKAVNSITDVDDVETIIKNALKKLVRF